MKKLLMTLAALALATTTFAQATPPTIYIMPMADGFEVYLTAAMLKKNVPVQVTTNPDGATYTMKASQVEISKESGASKIARCLFAYCVGIADSSSTSVTLTNKDGIVLWSYAVKKGKGAGNRQSMAEATAKHLNNDYLKKKR
ncbi:MAG: hypothetical protein ABI643_04365 [Candidatus Doudnabacteria bacterium]